jgi:hypothetical protein
VLPPKRNGREKHPGPLFYSKRTEERNTQVLCSTQREPKRETPRSSVLPKENRREKHQDLLFYPKGTEERNTKVFSSTQREQKRETQRS